MAVARRLKPIVRVNEYEVGSVEGVQDGLEPSPTLNWTLGNGFRNRYGIGGEDGEQA